MEKECVHGFSGKINVQREAHSITLMIIEKVSESRNAYRLCCGWLYGMSQLACTRVSQAVRDTIANIYPQRIIAPNWKAKQCNQGTKCSGVPSTS